jgi:hypothetical protein
LGGQKLVAVITTDDTEGWHWHWQPLLQLHLISKQAPQVSPLLKSGVLSAPVATPYPAM